MARKFDLTAKYFKNKRVELNLTQAELAEELGFSSPQIVSNWERGICSPPLNAAYKMVHKLGLPMNEVAEIMTEQSRIFFLEKLRPAVKKKRKAS